MGVVVGGLVVLVLLGLSGVMVFSDEIGNWLDARRKRASQLDAIYLAEEKAKSDMRVEQEALQHELAMKQLRDTMARLDLSVDNLRDGSSE